MHNVPTPRPRYLAAALVILAACSGRPSLDDPALSSRDLELEQFFSGPLIAHGQFQDRFGTVRARFRVDMQGYWDGETLRLEEDFTYDSGRTDRRVWTLRQTGPESWEGTAPDVIGTARGQEQGDTFNWTYSAELVQEDGSTFRADFDDWMWKLSDTRLLNRAYVRRFGVTLGEVIIYFEKPDSPERNRPGS